MDHTLGNVQERQTGFGRSSTAPTERDLLEQFDVGHELSTIGVLRNVAYADSGISFVDVGTDPRWHPEFRVTDRHRPIVHSGYGSRENWGKIERLTLQTKNAKGLLIDPGRSDIFRDELVP